MEELERRLEHPSSEARPLRGGPSPLGAGPGEVPGHSPSPYSPECVEGKFSEVHESDRDLSTNRETSLRSRACHKRWTLDRADEP
jgi:hypothetical protein